MKTLQLIRITLLAFLTIGFASCNKDNNGNNTNDEIIEYQGEYPAPESIEYVEEGVTCEIEAIPGQVVISTDEDYNTVINAVNAHGGKIIEQYPQYGLYTVEVVVGNENAFVAAMNDLNISAELNLVEYPKERYDYFVFDDYADANGTQHGRRVSNTLSGCQSDAVINEVNNVIKFIIPLNYTNFLLWDKLLSQDMVLVNWSHGYGSHSDDWQNMTIAEKNSYMIGWKKEVMRKLDQIIRLKKKNPNIDIVFAKAAGNERCPELSQMINDIKANPKYKKVLEENFIIVSDYSTYANTSSAHGDFCYIKEHPYYNPNGGTTSLATPQALCYINQVIKGTVGEDGKNITAVQALAAVKAAIRQNSNGELDLDEALAMARIMYSPGYFTGTPFNNTSWNVPYTMETTGSKTYRKSEYHYVPNGGSYYTYYNENQPVNESSSGVIKPSFKDNTLSLYAGSTIEFQGDSIIFRSFYDGEEYVESYCNNIATNMHDLGFSNAYEGTVKYNRYFVDDNTFCLKQELNYSYSYTSDYLDNFWIVENNECELIYEFKILNNGQCTFSLNNTDRMSSRYGSEYTGKIQHDYHDVGHGTGTYEHGVKDNVVNQGDNSNDLMFFSGIPMKRHK